MGLNICFNYLKFENNLKHRYFIMTEQLLVILLTSASFDKKYSMFELESNVMFALASSMSLLFTFVPYLSVIGRIFCFSQNKNDSQTVHSTGQLSHRELEAALPCVNNAKTIHYLLLTKIKLISGLFNWSATKSFQQFAHINREQKWIQRAVNGKKKTCSDLMNDFLIRSPPSSYCISHDTNRYPTYTICDYYSCNLFLHYGFSFLQICSTSAFCVYWALFGRTYVNQNIANSN